MSTIILTTIICAPIEICFDLSRSIDLHKSSMSHTNEKAIGGVTSGLIGFGEEVTWKAQHCGFSQKLTSRITAYNFPHYFQDQMVKGIFKRLVHDHFFEEKENYTLMRDEFQFDAPMGFVGKIAERFVLSDYLKNLLVKRNNIVKEIAETKKWEFYLGPK